MSKSLETITIKFDYSRLIFYFLIQDLNFICSSIEGIPFLGFESIFFIGWLFIKAMLNISFNYLWKYLSYM